MLFTISFPLVDKRPFLSVDTFRIPSDELTGHWDDVKFLRSFGLFGKRIGIEGGLHFQEQRYAKANRGVRIAKQGQRLEYKKTVIRPGCVFRRVFFDDYSARVDVGLKSGIRHTGPLYPSGARDAVEAFLRYNVYTARSIQRPVRIRDVGRQLAVEYLYATTKLPGNNWQSADAHWILSARPMILLEVEQRELVHGRIGNNRRMRRIDAIPESWGMELQFYVRGDGIPVWIIVRGEKPQKDMVRALRIYLLRFHQERETLRCFCEVASSLVHKDGALNVPAVEMYLNMVTSIFARPKRDGIEQQPIMEAARQADQAVYAVEYSSLLEYLERNLTYLKARCKKTMDNTFNIGNFNGNLVAGDNDGTMMYHAPAQPQIDAKRVEELLQELRKSVPEDSDDKGAFEKRAEEVKTELKKEKPDRTILERAKDALQHLKCFAECATTLAKLAAALGLGAAG